MLRRSVKKNWLNISIALLFFYTSFYCFNSFKKLWTHEQHFEKYRVDKTTFLNIFERAPGNDRRSYFETADEFMQNRTCKIPHIYPYEKEAMEILQREIIEKGIKIPHCVVNRSAKFKTDQITHLIRLLPGDSFWRKNNCCYTAFTGNGAMFKNLTDCIKIRNDVTIIPNIWENVQVQCKDIQMGRPTYRDYFHFFRLNSTREEKLDEVLNLHTDSKKDQLNIIFLGLDTVSFPNFQRLLPKTRRYLIEELKAIEFHGLNKIGRATLENLVPMLTNCGWSNIGASTLFPIGSEKCTMIWETYESEGYRTVASWEEYWTPIYHMMRRGNQGPMNTSTYDNFPFVERIHRNCPEARYAYGCCEHIFAIDILTERVLQVARKLQNKLYFHFVWSVLQTHEVTGTAKLLDNPLQSLLITLVSEALLNNSALIVTSDHGMVYSEYASTPDGNIEANAPLLYFVFPMWFRAKYSRAISNLNRNSKGLTTPRDIYQTLISLRNLSSVTNDQLESQSETGVLGKVSPAGISLFRPIPLERDCATARIPKQHCLCWAWTDVIDYATDAHVNAAAQSTLTHVNAHLRNYTACEQLTIKAILGGKRSTDSFGRSYVSVSFQTAPGGGKFNALLTVNAPERDGQEFTYRVVGQVERKNAYGKQSECLGDEMTSSGWIRSVCLCKRPE